MVDFDVIIVGAGLSGIGAAYRLQERLPRSRYAIFEAGDVIGGTWDLFRYPGIRSDSDMFTLAYPFKPWRARESIASGEQILQYIREAAAENGIDRHIRFGHRVVSASWSGDAWTVTAEIAGLRRTFRCRFLYACTGYYSYDTAHTPKLSGSERFGGRIVHPQWWPSDLSCEGRRVVVIGSGATAITLVPALAKTAAHVVMLQRSPTYVATLPSRDVIANLARAVLPKRLAHHVLRLKNVLFTMGIYQFSRRFPKAARRFFIDELRKWLPKDFAVDTHFSPRYAPWDQRLCLAPDGDLFVALRKGQASVETDTIDELTETGVKLRSGKHVDADIIVTATGLELLAIGGMQLEVDGHPVEVGKSLVYKGCMLSDVPNFAWCVGYINASWGLRSDIASRYVSRVIDFMERYGYARATPRPPRGIATRPVLDIAAGYVQRGSHRLPRQSGEEPWMLRQNYVRDYLSMHFGHVDDGALELSVSSDS